MSNADHRPLVAAQRRERMQARLVSAALKIAADRGVAAVTIDSVIAQAQVSRGTFYKYFETPSGLIEQVGREVADALLAIMNPTVSALPDPAARIAAGTRIVLRLAGRHPLLGNFMIRSGWPASDLTPGFHQTVGQTLAEGLAQERFAPMPAPLALGIVAGAVVGAMNAALSAPMTADLPELTAQAILKALGLNARQAQALAFAALDFEIGDVDVLLEGLLA